MCVYLRWMFCEAHSLILIDTMEDINKRKTEMGGSKRIVCVTGASGYVASWLVKRLLSSGYYVRGTVRDPGKYKKLEHLWQLEGAKERLQLVKADLMKEGSFDEAVMGCEGVFHTASPVIGQSDPKVEILDPAIMGTLNVLSACKKNPYLKRVVLTSSSSAVRAREIFDGNSLLDESSWSCVDLCERLKIWYAMSKTMAEKAAWEFAAANEIDLVTVVPSFIIGPSLPRDLSPTASDVLGLLKGDSDKFSDYGRMGYVHIDDVARCHILVYEDPAAKGRYLCSSTVLENHELATLLEKRFPSLPITKRLASCSHQLIHRMTGLRGMACFGWHLVELNHSGTQVKIQRASAGLKAPFWGLVKFEKKYSTRQCYDFNTSKLRSLGFEFKGIEEMFDDCITSLKEQGHLL